MTTTAPAPAMPGYAIYARLSRKPAGRKRNDRETVQRQEMLCRKYAAENGIAVSDAHIYVDNHRSAWQDDGRRERWNDMLAAGQRGEFPGILAYKLDRFARNVRDAEDLVDLAEHIVVDGPNSGRINLRTAHGRKTFRDAAAAAAYESDNTSERTRDALAERAANGLILGSGRLYGWEMLSQVREDEDDVTGRQRPDEAEVIREVAGRMIAGQAVTAIADDLNERGLRSAAGRDWTVKSLTRVMAAPRNGGWATLRGEVVGRQPGTPILDPGTYAQVQALIGGRRKGPRPTGTYPLTGVMHCDTPECRRRGRTMSGYPGNGGQRKYTCGRASNGTGCGMTIHADWAEGLVKLRVLADANDAELRTELDEQTRARHSARAGAAAEVERLDDELARLEVRKLRRDIRDHAYEVSKAELDRLIAEAEAKLHRLTAEAGGEPGGQQVPPVTEAEWDAMTGDEKRATIRNLRLDIVVHRPTTRGRSQVDPSRVEILP